MRDSKRHPITYDPRYVDSVQKRRNKTTTARMQKLAEEANVEVEVDVLKTKSYVDPDTLKRNIEKGVEQDMDRVSAEDALDDSLAYYEVSPSAQDLARCRFLVHADNYTRMK